MTCASISQSLKNGFAISVEKLGKMAKRPAVAAAAILFVPGLFILLGHILYTNLDSYLFSLIVMAPMFVGLGFLGLGYIFRLRSRHILMAVGWLVFSLYWGTQVDLLYWEEGGFINAAFGAAAVYLFAYLAYHEVISHAKKENFAPLEFMAGATFVAAFFYFLVERIPSVSRFLITEVADQSAGVLRLFGHDFTSGVAILPHGAPWFAFNAPIYYNGEMTNISIILACTALQSIMIFVGAIYATTGKIPLKRRIAALAATAIPIYVLNLFRNAGVIWAVIVRGWDFGIVHDWVAKFGVLLVLVALAYIVFKLLPELYDDLAGLLDLPKRNGPVERFFRERFGKKPETLNEQGGEE
ncbi:MAG: archaeosortase A [Thermoplasmata archaeon HGW-Thermoplasmata-1]|nr:MAG: archaeosortase A [Thermoplasmata archaeon HGW-Thermoplasmata-1]